MTKKKILTSAVFIFLLLALGAGIFKVTPFLEDCFYWMEMAENPRLIEAGISSQGFIENSSQLKPYLEKDAEPLPLSAKAALSLFVGPEREEVLFEKNSRESLPIASLTKLVSALVITDNYSMDQRAVISSEAAGMPGNGEGNLKAGDAFMVGDLFKAMLVESNNSAVLALAQIKGEEEFVYLMNAKAEDMGLQKTLFSNPTGLDPKDGSIINQSSAAELAEIAKFITEEKPDIFEILSMAEFDLYDTEGLLSHKAVNTNELLGEMPLIIGGKTGETPRSGGCLLLVVQAPKSRGYLVNVILDSPDRFSEMEKLVDWVKHSYQW
jgi:serine-type D-Ala-D-Ala carboxypeptidase (penicillin-binding protein 5/6)